MEITKLTALEEVTFCSGQRFAKRGATQVKAESEILFIFAGLFIDSSGNFGFGLSTEVKLSHKSDYIVDVDIYFIIKFKFRAPRVRL